MRKLLRKRAEISISNETLVLSDKDSITVALEEIQQVAVFNRDEITTDLICCEINFRSSDGELVVTINEEQKNFDAAMNWLGKLPGFNHDWRSVVARPTFARNWTVVFPGCTE